jgi:hypothetical protein
MIEFYISSRQFLSQHKIAVLYSGITVFMCVMFSIIAIDGIWNNFNPPFQIERDRPHYLAPIDGVYYVKNSYSYVFDSSKTYEFLTSVWYHPLMSWLVALFSKAINFFGIILPNKYIYFSISLVFSFLSVFISFLIIQNLFNTSVPPSYILLTPIIPGGFNIAVGNTETLTLFLCLMVIYFLRISKNNLLAIFFSSLAILSKPNAIYLIGFLIAYTSFDIKFNFNRAKIYFLCIVSLLLTWLVWMLFVDAQVGSLGAYWNARLFFGQFVAGSWHNFFVVLIESFLKLDFRDMTRYSLALIVPLSNIYLLSLVSFKDKKDHFAFLFGNLVMLFICLWQGNPNKIMLYATTLPYYFSIYLVIFAQLPSVLQRFHPIKKIIFGCCFGAYLIFCLGVFLIGTPLGFYY